MRFDLTKSFLDKANRVVMSEDTPFDVIKKAYDLTTKIQTEDKFGKKYNIREDLLVRYSALKRLLRLQVDDKILRGREKFSEFFNDLNEFEKQIKAYVEKQEVISASENDIKYVEKFINVKLKYNIINTQANKLIDFLQDFKDDSSTSDVEELVEEYSDLISRTNNDFIKLRNSFDDKKKSFSMEDTDKLKELFSDYLRAISNKSRFVKAGIKWFNDTFSGFEKDRFYLFLAASGRGKSVVLLNTAIWAIKYNTYEDVTKAGQIPISLYLTLENTITETLVRLLGYTGGKKLTEDFKKGRISVEEVTKIINSEIVNAKDPNNSAKLAIEYRNKGTQSMEDINKIIDDLEADGKHKVVFVAIDYIENIKSDYVKKDDVRMSLAQLGTEFSNMAKNRALPVVSAMQMNREATVKIESGTDNLEEYFKSIKSVGASNVAESLKLIQLVDLAIFIDKRKSEIPGDPDSLTFRIVKQRVDLNGPNSTRMHTHSFQKENGIRLEEDVYDAVSKSTPIMNQEPGVSRGASAPALKPRK